MDLKQHIRSIPNFPKPGILFYDISTLLAHPQAWRATVERLAEEVRPHRPDLLVGPRLARGDSATTRARSAARGEIHISAIDAIV